MLIDHTVAIDVNAAGTSQQTQTYLKGFCPICESAMSSTMLGLISSYKELYKLPVEDKNMVCKIDYLMTSFDLLIF